MLPDVTCLFNKTLIESGNGTKLVRREEYKIVRLFNLCSGYINVKDRSCSRYT
jgi:hypothetical protein